VAAVTVPARYQLAGVPRTSLYAELQWEGGLARASERGKLAERMAQDFSIPHATLRI